MADTDFLRKSSRTLIFRPKSKCIVVAIKNHIGFDQIDPNEPA